MSERDVVVVGGGLTKFAAERADASVRDLVVEAVMSAVEDAGVDLHNVEHGLTSYESDHFNRQMTLGAILHDHIGMVPKPNVRVEGGGATGALALRTAFAYIKSGLCDSIIVYGGETNGKSVTSATAQQFFALSSDADWEMMVGGTYTAYYAAMMRAHMSRYGTTERQFARVAVKNRRNAQYNAHAQKPMNLTVDEVLASPPVADPYKLLDCSLLSDGAAAMILATVEWAAAHSTRWGRQPNVYFTATGCGTDTMRLGDRPHPYPGLTHFRGKREAARQAYATANITDPLHQIDVAELYDSYSGVELQAYEDLGFCEYGHGGPAAESGVFDLGGELPVNTSGGLLGRGAPVGATGIAQAIEIMLQLRGAADPRRQVPNARRGLTDTHAGTGTHCVVNIFERRD
ncbi:MAG: thiolase domain-containing protein [Chloroflexi bacterium]|nr:thiolase domain-containing protein [Chloroflexota bacterium]